ncbi:pentatricopeptide repeat-containing protein [Tanacetum coccineum]
MPKIADEFTIKGNHLTLVKGNQFDGRIKTDPDKHVHEFLSVCDMFKYGKTKNKAVRLMMFLLSLTGNSNSDTDKILARMDSMTMKMDAQYKEIQSRAKCNHCGELSLEIIKPTKMSVRFADRSFQYPIRIAGNMLVEVGKFTFPMDFVILEMEEDSKVPLILGRPFLHTADAEIRCDVIDEILKEYFDALLDEGSKIFYSIEGTLLEDKIFAEFDEFIAINIEENSESDSDKEEITFKKITFDTEYKIKKSLDEPPTDLELKPLPNHLEYAFLEEPYFLPVIISSQLSEQNKNKLVSVLKRHKQVFSWKTIDILAVDHLSRIENDETSDNDDEIDDNFPDETLIEISTRDIQWSAEIENYLGTCVFTDKWSLDELAYGVPTDGPYQTNHPSPDDIIASILIDREGQVRRIRHEEEIDVHKYQILTREFVPTLKPLEEIIQENIFCLGGNRDHVRIRQKSQENRQKRANTDLAYYMAKRMEWVTKQKRLILPYGMLLTRLFKLIMNENHDLYNESYVLYDRVMNPLAAQQERKTRKDRGTRRGRHSTSSSFAFDQPSSSHLNDDDDDGNGEGTSRASTPSPIRYVNSLTNEVPQVFQNPPNIDPHLEPFYTRQTEIINRQVQIRDEHRGGLRSIGKGLRNLWRNIKK